MPFCREERLGVHSFGVILIDLVLQLLFPFYLLHFQFWSINTTYGLFQHPVLLFTLGSYSSTGFNVGTRIVRPRVRMDKDDLNIHLDERCPNEGRFAMLNPR